MRGMDHRHDQPVGLEQRQELSRHHQAAFRIAKGRFFLRKGEVKAARLALVEGLDRVPIDQKATLHKAIGEFHQTQGDRAAARLAFLEWAGLRPDAIEPRLALLNLAIEAGDDRAVNAEVEALKVLGGPRSLYWKIAKAEALLRNRSDAKIPAADLDRLLAADEPEVAAELEQELLELLDQTALQVGLGVLGRKVKKLDEVLVFKERRGIGMQFCQRC